MTIKIKSRTLAITIASIIIIGVGSFMGFGAKQMVNDLENNRIQQIETAWETH